MIERVKDFESFLKLNHLSPLVNDLQPQKEKSRTSIALDVDKKSAEKMNLTDKEWLIHKTYGILTTIWRNCLEGGGENKWKERLYIETCSGKIRI